MQMLHFDPKRHFLTPLEPLTSWLLREFPERSLFLYKHKQTNNFVIAEWISKEKGMVLEQYLVGEHPGKFDKEDAVELRRRLRNNTTGKDFVRMAGDFERAMDEQAMVDQEEMWTKPRHKAKAQMVVPTVG